MKMYKEPAQQIRDLIAETQLFRHLLPASPQDTFILYLFISLL